MDLPIDDKELEMLVWMSEHISGDGAEELHKKLKLVKEVRDENPGAVSYTHLTLPTSDLV